MKIAKRMLGWMIFCVLTAAVQLTAWADGETIDHLDLEVVSTVRVGEPCSPRDIEITVQNSGYEVRDVELLNTGATWGSADVPRFIVYLKADDGYTFAIDRMRNRIRGAEIEYGRWDDNMYRYVLQIRLPSLREQVGEIGETRWDSLTTAGWSASYNAVSYELQLYRGDKKQGPLLYSTENRFDFGGYMRAEGTYYYKVRAINLRDYSIRSEWKESPCTVVDAAAAEQLRQQYASASVNGPGMQSAVPYYQDMYGWILEGARWWYRNADGSYTTSDWQYIDDKWYYFDSQGYMVTGWIDWKDKSYYCDPESGAMLVSTIVPDGMGRRVDSTGAWIQ